MTEVKKDGYELVIDGKRISLPAAIESIVQTQNTVVVLLDSEGEVESDRNIWGFTNRGSFLWEAEKVQAPSNDANCYVRIWEEEGNVWASDWKGLDYRIDIETGEQLDKKFRK
ncbi:hypothetical protein [Haloterrigena salina]|uniref:hypothetical protein n=1 Tax=Haloterrigena salina TaxID=504937 RepID=UPI00126837F7|nr:hypothetical protein [Haloterrigena salina]